jgi:hypothetical protein
MRDWQAAKQEVHRLRQKLSEATNLKEVRKHMDTRTLIQKDKVLPLCSSSLVHLSFIFRKLLTKPNCGLETGQHTSRYIQRNTYTDRKTDKLT